MARGVEYVPTDEHRAMVKALAVHGLPQKRIAVVIGVNHRTLTKYYRAELDIAKDEFLGLCVNKLQTLVNRCNPAAVFFALKTQGGWRERDSAPPAEENKLKRFIPHVGPDPTSE